MEEENYQEKSSTQPSQSTIPNNEVVVGLQAKSDAVADPDNPSNPMVTPPPSKPEVPLSSPPFSFIKPSLPDAEHSLPASITDHGIGISWEASEFIAHSKSIAWYAALALCAAVLAVVIWIFTHDTVSSIVIIAGAAVFGYYGARQPRQVEYHLDTAGLSVGQRHFNLDHFRSYAIKPEGAFSSIVFTPLKRFSLLTTIYYPPEEEPKILELISARLPLENLRDDVVDRALSRIRF